MDEPDLLRDQILWLIAGLWMRLLHLIQFREAGEHSGLLTSAWPVLSLSRFLFRLVDKTSRCFFSAQSSKTCRKCTVLIWSHFKVNWFFLRNRQKDCLLYQGKLIQTSDSSETAYLPMVCHLGFSQWTPCYLCIWSSEQHKVQKDHEPTTLPS